MNSDYPILHPDCIYKGSYLDQLINDSRDTIDNDTANLIQQATNTSDDEGNHIRADQILTDLLIRLGFKKTVTAFQEVDKWYS